MYSLKRNTNPKETIMKTTFLKATLSILFAMSLTACGAGASTEQTQMFSIDMGRQYSMVVSVQGLGATPEDRRYDAVAYVVSGVQAGTEAHKAMLGHGLAITVDGAYMYVVTLRVDGMHIEEAVAG